jgi:two-component system cell cycle response regulator
VSRRKALAEPAANGKEPASKRSKRDASLVVVYGAELGRRVLLDQPSFTIGRSSSCDLPIYQDAVSRKHAEIAYARGRYSVYDLRSRNGTRLNDERVTEHALSDGDKIQIGQTIFTFLRGDDVDKRYQDEIYRVMTVDGLTGAYNKRYFGEALERETARALRYERRLSLVLFDVDRFDQILAEHGPLAADTLLRDVATAVRVRLRRQDILGRLGGSSFGVLLPEIDLAGALTTAEKVQAIVDGAEIHYDLATLSCTVSAGVAALPLSDPTPQSLLQAAQTALVDAKNSGISGLGVAGSSTCRP